MSAACCPGRYRHTNILQQYILMTEKLQKDYIGEYSLFKYHVQKVEGSE